MSGVLAIILKLFGDAFGRAISDWLAAMRHDQLNRELGQRDAQANLEKQVKDAADEQSKINLTDRGGAAGVGERLRKAASERGTGV